MPWMTNEIKCSCGKKHDLVFDDWVDGTAAYAYFCPVRGKQVTFRAYVAADAVDVPPEGAIKVELLTE